MERLTGSVFIADVDCYTVTHKLPFYASLVRTEVTRSLAGSSRGDEKPRW